MTRVIQFVVLIAALAPMIGACSVAQPTLDPVSTLTSGTTPASSPTPISTPTLEYLTEEIPPCTPMSGSSVDPCDPDVELAELLFPTAGASSLPLLGGEPQNLREMLEFDGTPSAASHLVLRGTFLPGTERCTSRNPYQPPSYLSSEDYDYVGDSLAINCYADVRANAYILGSGPPTLTTRTFWYLYWDGDFAGMAAEEDITEQEFIEELRLRFETLEYAGGVGGREAVLFIGPPSSLSAEAWELRGAWDVQRRDDGTVVAIHPDRDLWQRLRPDDYQTHRSTLEMELPAFTQAVTTANQARVDDYGGRIGADNRLPMLVTDANQLRQAMTDAGAYVLGTPTPVQPPPSTITQCRSGGAVPRPDDNLTLLLDCAALLRAKDHLRGTAALNWSHDTQITTWDGVTVDRDQDNSLFVRDLALADRGLNGFIPSALVDLTALRRLDLDDNALSGPLPPLLSGLTSLQQLYVSGNSLTGQLPPQWADLPNLRFLFLNGNDLSGTLPPEWGGMGSLEQLVLDGNGLSGDIPPEWSGMSSLEDLFLRDNALSGSIPPELDNLGSLEDLYLEGNAFTGCIPAGLRDTEQHDLATLGLPYCAAGT